MFYTRSLIPNAGRVNLLAIPGTDLSRQKRIKITQITFISNRITFLLLKNKLHNLFIESDIYLRE
jgi:hypothetical protein